MNVYGRCAKVVPFFFSKWRAWVEGFPVITCNNLEKSKQLAKGILFTLITTAQTTGRNFKYGIFPLLLSRSSLRARSPCDYDGGRSEPRENARGSGKAARGVQLSHKFLRLPQMELAQVSVACKTVVSLRSSPLWTSGEEERLRLGDRSSTLVT